jgi:hypothetical protein
VLFFDSEDHPDASSRDFDGRDYHDDDVGFHGDSAKDIRRDVEHPDEPKDKVEEDDSIVNFFVAIDHFLSKVSVLGVEESPVIPNVHVVGERSGGKGSQQPDVKEVVIMRGLVFAKIGCDHGDKTEHTFCHRVNWHASTQSVLVHHSAILDYPEKI